MNVSKLLVLGGARSGKSALAQQQAEATGLTTIYIATGQAFDSEMAARIAAHVSARGPAWRTVDAPFDLAAALTHEAGAGKIVLVDCLTLWLSNVLLRGDDAESACAALVAAVDALQGPAIFVSNEVGAGIVPENALARRFRDAQGRLNQQMAAACSQVVFVAAGLPLVLKPAPAFRLDS